MNGEPPAQAVGRCAFACPCRVLGLAVVLPVIVFLAMSMSMSGCVLPIGPEFAEEKNEPPIAVSVMPPEGSSVTALRQVFEVTVEDPNRIDTLFARWLVDFPPFNQEISRIIPVPEQPASNPNSPNRQQLRFQPSCEGDFAISPTLTRHRVMLLVSDRKFTDALTGTPADAFTLQITWNFDRVCPASQ